MSETRVFKDFDIATNHLPGNQHYVPDKARKEEEKARRRALRAGTLLLEKQARGISIMGLALDQLEEPEDIHFGAGLFAIAAFNTVWYLRSRGAEAEVMRRRGKLAVLDEDDQGVMSLWPRALDRIRDSVPRAHLLVAAHEHAPAKAVDLKKQIASSLGTASVELACVRRQEIFHRDGAGVTAASRQNFVRQSYMWTVHYSRTMAGEIGDYPSAAGLADQDSAVSVYCRRKGTNGFVKALESAAESPLAA